MAHLPYVAKRSPRMLRYGAVEYGVNRRPILSPDWGRQGQDVQRKIFRIEQTMPVRRSALTNATSLRAEGDERRPSAHAAPHENAPAIAVELAQLRDIIDMHKRDLAALIGDRKDRRMARGAGELGAAVDSMEKGAETILKSAEAIDDNARALCAALSSGYERGLAHDIQEHTVRIFEACNFQDIAGQRIGKVIATLNAVEEQLTAMQARCNGAHVLPVPAPARGNGLLNGPSLDGDAGHATQQDIDAMFA